MTAAKVPTVATAGPRVVIRPMNHADVNAVKKLCRQLGFEGTGPALRDRYERMRQYSTHESFVADFGRAKSVGWVHVYEAPSLLSKPTAEIGGMAVDIKYRRRGVGARLMRTAEDWAIARGCQSVLLATQVKRKDAQAFYRALGYKVELKTYFMRKDAIENPGAAQRSNQSAVQSNAHTSTTS